MTRPKPMTDIGDEGERWHLNLGVPVVWIVGSLVIGLIQLGGVIWYASQFNSRVSSVEIAQVASSQIIEKVQATATAQGNQLVRLDERVIALQATASRIESLLTPVKTR